MLVDRKYWMVNNPEGGSPTAKHYTKAEATIEARRLASRNVGKQFNVLEVREGYIVEVPDPKVVTFLERV